jgi:hypothetical protein
MNLPVPPDLSVARIDVVLDTNILFDALSIHDLVGTYDKYLDATTFNINDPNLVLRRARAREALLLLLFCHEKQLRTFSLDKIAHLVPPNNPAFAAQYTSVFIHFVRMELLVGWREFSDENCDASIKGNDCDSFLVKTCRKNMLPLVTHEGYGPNGIDSRAKIRKQAADAGVPVFTAREFWSGKLDPQRAIDSFCEEFDLRAPEFIRRSFPEHEHRLAERTFDRVRGSLNHVLWGGTANTKELACIELPAQGEVVNPMFVQR